MTRVALVSFFFFERGGVLVVVCRGMELEKLGVESRGRTGLPIGQFWGALPGHERGSTWMTVPQHSTASSWPAGVSVRGKQPTGGGEMQAQIDPLSDSTGSQ